jgi:endonuclease/exonuclease/phosphatase family metal-dependent hydrolase
MMLMAGGATGLLAALIGFASGRAPTGGKIIATPNATSPTLNSGDSFTFVSWNIHYGGGPTLARGRGQSREEVVRYLDEIAGYIRSWDADIVALQEVDREALRSFDIDQLHWLQQATGLNHAAWTPTWDARWVPHPGLNPAQHIGRVRSGQVVLSRFPLSDDQHIRLPQPATNLSIYNRFYLHRHLTNVSVTLGPDIRLQLVNAHLEAFDEANRRVHADIAQRLLSQRTGMAILAGDMNCTPPEAKRRRAFEDEPDTDMSSDNTIDMLRQISGMSEVVPAKVYAANEKPWFTFPAHKPNRRLDYVFHSEGLSLISAEVPVMTNPPSDHLPIVVRFELN